MRRPRYGTIQSAVRGALDATGKRDKDVADFLGVRGSTLSYATEESDDRPGGLGVNYLHRLALAHPAAAVPLAQHFAAMAGGVYQPIDTEGRVVSLFEHVSLCAKESGEAISAMVMAAEHASAGNLEAAARETDEAIAQMLAFRAEIHARVEGAA